MLNVEQKPFGINKFDFNNAMSLKLIPGWGHNMIAGEFSITKEKVDYLYTNAAFPQTDRG